MPPLPNTTTGFRTRPHLRGAFSLAELIMTLAIMVVIAALAAPRIARSSERYRLELAAARLERDLINAREQAIATSSTQGLEITPATQTYSNPAARGDNGSTSVLTVRLADPPYELDGVATSANGPMSVRFNGFGVPDGSATIRLSLRGQIRIVEVLPGTGAVRVNR